MKLSALLFRILLPSASLQKKSSHLLFWSDSNKSRWQGILEDLLNISQIISNPSGLSNSNKNSISLNMNSCCTQLQLMAILLSNFFWSKFVCWTRNPKTTDFETLEVLAYSLLTVSSQLCRLMAEFGNCGSQVLTSRQEKIAQTIKPANFVTTSEN